MIKVYCDFCDKEIHYDKESSYSLSLELNFNSHDSKIVDEQYPGMHNKYVKTYCTLCYYNLREYFNNISAVESFDNFKTEVYEKLEEAEKEIEGKLLDAEKSLNELKNRNFFRFPIGEVREHSVGQSITYYSYYHGTSKIDASSIEIHFYRNGKLITDNLPEWRITQKFYAGHTEIEIPLNKEVLGCEIIMSYYTHPRENEV